MTDVLSEIMRRVRLKACVYFQRDFCAPWAMEMADTGFAQFHVITSGACQLSTGAEIHSVGTGDVLFFPHGAAHTLSDQPGRRAVPGPQFMASLATEAPMFSQGVPATRMICGHYAYRWEVSHPLLTQLPDLIHLPADRFAGSTGITVPLQLIMAELARQEPGYELSVEHLAEVLLVQTLRHYCRMEGRNSGFLSALNDPRLARAIALVHTRFSGRLTLLDMADAAAMSRSAFSQRFSDLVQMSPVDYLANWRMLIARDLLLNTNGPVAEVAEQVGYGSDIAFARAFKRSNSSTPSEFRAKARA
ncbi:MAG: AraC family transcriptional regulator [Rhodobacteraceae bacterium]|nr:AraC family transcriptional regulator [Paracoccaceae bacterium]